PHGPVVVGVDGSAWTEPALAAAFAEAAARGTGVVAVHAWADDVVDPAVTALVDPDGRAEDERRLLDDALAPWADKHPDVRVRRVLAHDRPARALVTESGWAQLVVVGSRGRGGVAGMPLGSVGRALLSHAHCPVLVARDGPG
ncbi:universal stress protein, partial [Pseudonocardia spirodelae]